MYVDALTATQDEEDNQQEEPVKPERTRDYANAVNKKTNLRSEDENFKVQDEQRWVLSSTNSRLPRCCRHQHFMQELLQHPSYCKIWHLPYALHYLYFAKHRQFWHWQRRISPWWQEEAEGESRGLTEASQ